MFGHAAAEVLGQPLTLLMSEQNRELHLAGLRRVQSGGESHVIGCSVELEGRRKDSSEFPLDLSLAKWTSGEGWFVTGMMTDITERKRLEAQFLQAQKMETVGRMASGIAHDFNNLLTVINGTADLALTGLKEGAPLHTDLQDIRQAGERGALLTRQLLAFSRKQIMVLEVLNLSTLIADLQGMLQRLIGEDIALVVVPAKDLGSVMADPTQIEQVVMNLAVNARDAMPKGGTLTIETRDVELDEAYAAEHPSVRPGPHVMLAISDTGTGMDAATRARLFEPFFTTKDPGKGTGLGLSTVYGIVKQGGGSIWAYSEPGKRTTFKIYLPRVEGVVRKIQHAPAVTSVQGTETILVVEDEDAVRRLAERVLQRGGYTVLTASNGAEALLVLERHDGPVHLVLTDMVMPGMSGRDLMARLEDINSRMKVLCTSGYTDEAVLHHKQLDKAAHFIGKPYAMAELTRKVREVLDSPA
jgi:PAS domain S-box-containing protein